MIYLTKTDEGKEKYNIISFLTDEKKWKSYLILVIVNPGDEMLVSKQIHRQKLDEVNWFITTVEDLTKIVNAPGFRYKELGKLLVMNIVMTGNDKDCFSIHNLERLTIDHEPRTAPFDEVFAKGINSVLEQAYANYNSESIPVTKKLDKMFYDFMMSGMFMMQPDPKKTMGLG